MAEPFPIFEFSEPEAIQSIQSEPVGSKEKFWFFTEKEGVYTVSKSENPSDSLWLIKINRFREREKIYDGEDWAEVIASCICEKLRIPHAHYDFAEVDGQRGVITERFTKRGESLIHMDEAMELPAEESTQARRKRSRGKYVFGAIWNILSEEELLCPPREPRPESIKTPLDLFVGYLMLDALIGNSDRHEQNLCLIYRYNRNGTKWFLAPTYDHASSLGRELLDKKREELLANETKFALYLDSNMSKIYASEAEPRQMSTMEAFTKAAKLNPKAAKIWLDRLEQLKDDDVRRFFERIPGKLISRISIQFSLKLIAEKRNVLLKLKKSL